MKYYLTSKKVQSATAPIRILGVAYMLVMVWCFLWVVTNLDERTLFETILSSSFLFAIFLTFIGGLVSVINNWKFAMVRPSKLPYGLEPNVAIIVPTYVEPVGMVLKTLKSITDQNWPKNKRIIIVSDDGRRKELKKEIDRFKIHNHEINIIYTIPPSKSNPRRRGEGKAGNLNSALELVIRKYPQISYVETRDADDLLGTKNFLRYCLKPLCKNKDLAYVQTIKKCLVSPGDPFSNQEALFYERIMPARNAANAAFPCGSGLVWNIQELKKIGGFPSWNLVEDLQSGYEALRLGGKSLYLPIVGTLGQIAPEDIPNFYKQRGTWALDTMRLFFWRNPFYTKGLSFRQKLHFFELEFYYLLSFATIIFTINLALSLLFHVFPVSDSQTSYLIHFGLLGLIMETYNYIKARGIGFKNLWRSRQIQVGLSPVFILATIKALVSGPNNKPVYKVTRKTHQFAFYWKEILTQFVLASLLVCSILYSFWFVRGSLFSDITLLIWASFFLVCFIQTIRNSWFGIRLNYKLPTINFGSKSFQFRTSGAIS